MTDETTERMDEAQAALMTALQEALNPPPLTEDQLRVELVRILLPHILWPWILGR